MGLILINSLTPPIGRDAVMYHLKMPQHYIQTKYVYPELTNFYSFFPPLIEMLYTFTLMLSNDYSSHLLHFYFGILAALTIFAFVRRISDLDIAIFTALIFYSLPIVSQLSSWAYVDLALCFYTILSVCFLSKALAQENINTPLIKLSAILLGLALGIKYFTLLSLYLIVILFLIKYINIQKTKRPFLLRQGLIFVVLSALIASPWYLRNIFMTGNPFYPFFYSLFGGPYWSLEQAKLYEFWLRHNFSMGHSIIDYLLIPWRLAVYGTFDGPFDGKIGPIYLTLTPLIILFKPRHKFAKYLLMYSALFFFCWINISQQARFLLPALAILTICLYAIFELDFKGTIVNHHSIRLLTIGLVIYNLLFVFEQFKRYQPLAFITGKINREEFLLNHLRNYRPIQYINKNLSQNSKILMVAMGNVGYYCKKPFIQETLFEDYTFRKIMTSSKSPEQILSWFKKQGATHFLINEVTASKFIYTDLDPLHLNIYSMFRNKYLRIGYADAYVVLYKILSESKYQNSQK